MIDEDGYRLNVGLILVNKKGQLFWGKRVQQEAWQFPQGGIRENETPSQAAFRELKEEVGLNPSDIRVLGRTEDWLSYNLPKQYVRYGNSPLCIGQKQLWFLMGMQSQESAIDLRQHSRPEFESWSWVDYWQPVHEVVEFKKGVYHKALTELEPFLHKFWMD